MIARHCFGEEPHPGHQWRTFGVGNGGVWFCDGRPILAMRCELDSIWRWRSR